MGLRRLGGPIEPGNYGYFQVIITAPETPGRYDFAARMVELPGDFFGERLIASITVQGQQRQWDCSYQGGLPEFMVAGTTETVTVDIKNEGTRGWPSGNWFCLYSRDDLGEGDFEFWGPASTCAGMPYTVPHHGGTASLTFDITAPNGEGTYQFLRQINDQRSYEGVGIFDLDDHCVDETIEVVGPQYALWNEPASNYVSAMHPGETRIFTFVMDNVGTMTWPGDKSITLYSQSTPRSKWGFVHDQLEVETSPGGSATFTMRITAPQELGDHEFRYQLRDLAGGGYFGEPVLFTMTVDENVVPQYDAVIVAQSIPDTMNPGEDAEFRITVRNTGFADWDSSSFGLRSRNSPASLWRRTLGKLDHCLPVAALGGECEVTIDARAPAAPGTYLSQWQMIDQTGISWFGEWAISTVLVAQCGNGTLENDEVCDDGNALDGDGCSATCTIEPTWIDLAVDSSDRTFIGAMVNKQLSNVLLADVTGDGVPDLIASEMVNFLIDGKGRNQAGRVVVWDGASDLIDGSMTTSPDGSIIEIIGADTHDRIGGTQDGRIAVADVTGDGIDDLIFSTPSADGPDNSRSNGGEVHVMLGGATLTGQIDMQAPGAALGATFYGAAENDGIILLDAGDVNGDGIADLIMGVPGDDTNGVNAGGAIIAWGGGDLADRVDIDLGERPDYPRILGPTAGEKWGRIGRCGDIIGGGDKDILVGNHEHVVNGMSKAGAAWALAGPFGAGEVRDLAAGQYDARWLGGSIGERMGDFVAIGNVRGDATLDAVISVRRLPDPGKLPRG